MLERDCYRRQISSSASNGCDRGGGSFCPLSCAGFLRKKKSKKPCFPQASPCDELRNSPYARSAPRAGRQLAVTQSARRPSLGPWVPERFPSALRTTQDVALPPPPRAGPAASNTTANVRYGFARPKFGPAATLRYVANDVLCVSCAGGCTSNADQRPTGCRPPHERLAGWAPRPPITSPLVRRLTHLVWNRADLLLAVLEDPCDERLG